MHEGVCMPEGVCMHEGVCMPEGYVVCVRGPLQAAPLAPFYLPYLPLSITSRIGSVHALCQTQYNEK